MKNKISKCGNKLTSVEYAVMDIDEGGDADCVTHFDTKSEALKWAEQESIKPGRAIVIEKQTRRYPAPEFDEPTKEEIIYTRGCKDALAAGGWE